MTKAERSRALRYKRPALQSMGYVAMSNELIDIMEACSDVVWYMDQDDETLINALDGNEDDAWEFKMAFSDLTAKVEQLQDAIRGWMVREEYDDCTVALIGNRYSLVGYDSFEENYYSLTGYDPELATTEAGKRLMRHTKAEIISTVGQCLGILVAFLDLRQQYDYLKATMDILRDENTSLLKQVKEIEKLYEAAAEERFCAWSPGTKKLDMMISYLPDRLWVE